ncbi:MULTISPECIES: HIT family protein [unclassified Nostoc]|uniref:HIT family protein n=1 Tax=unclassified Nostoc TaxID=2593658 RepID=UPI00343D3132
MIKLKRHCEHLAELISEEANALGRIIQNTCSALSQVIKPAKIHVCSWGEQVKHIHFHVIPRSSAMPVGNLKLLIISTIKKVTQSARFKQVGKQYRSSRN